MKIKFKSFQKQKGISILIAFTGSLLVLLITLGVLFSVQKSLDQTAALERSMKFSFAAESGVEAAIYHHNARGTGAHFVGTDSSQEVDHLGNITVSWTLDGRSKTLTTGSRKPIIGLLKEDESVQIPLFWDSVANPSLNASISGISNASRALKISFYDDSTTMSTDDQAEFGLIYNDDIVIPGAFIFGEDSSDDETLIDWSLTRNDSTNGVQTFTPLAPCSETPTDFICETSFGVIDPFDIASPAGASDTGSGGSNDTINGRITPGLYNATFEEFLRCTDSGASTSGSSCSNYTLSFKMLLPTEDANGLKIPGIPYVVEYQEDGIVHTSIPKSAYTITTDVSDPDYAHSVTVTIPERTTIGAFDYVILD